MREAVHLHVYRDNFTFSPTKQKLLLGVFPTGFANFRLGIYDSTDCCVFINLHFFFPYLIGEACITRSSVSEVYNFLARFLVLN